MKSKIWVGIVAVLVLIAGIGTVVALSSKKEVPQTSQKKLPAAPLFSEPDAAGRGTVSLADYQGKVVLLNIWDTWCPPCRMEIPDLMELHASDPSNFAVIGLAIGREGKDTVVTFIRNNKINYPVILLTQGILDRLGNVSAIPTSFVINRRGEIAETVVGYRDRAGYERIIRPYLDEK